MCVTSKRRRSITFSTIGNMSSSQLIKKSLPIKPASVNSASFATHVSKPTVSAAATTTTGSSQRRQVAHVYHDHSRDMPSIMPHVTRGGVKTPFPVRLHNMLSGVEAEGLTHIVSWQPHGRSFLVHKAKEFVDQVMPKYFNQGKFASFQRQLNLYGFKRLTRGPDTGSYYNELFLKGRPFLAHDIHRTKIKGNGARAASNPDAEPNFYAMPRLATEQKVQQQVQLQVQLQACSIPQRPVLPMSRAMPQAVSSAPAVMVQQQQVQAQPQPRAQQPVVSSEDTEWDSTADYLLGVLDDVLESNMDDFDDCAAPVVACHPGAPQEQAATPPAVPAIKQEQQQEPDQTISLSKSNDGHANALPLVSDDEDDAAFYSEDNLDDILAGVDLESDFELGMILEKMVSE